MASSSAAELYLRKPDPTGNSDEFDGETSLNKYRTFMRRGRHCFPLYSAKPHIDYTKEFGKVKLTTPGLKSPSYVNLMQPIHHDPKWKRLRKKGKNEDLVLNETDGDNIEMEWVKCVLAWQTQPPNENGHEAGDKISFDGKEGVIISDSRYNARPDFSMIIRFGDELKTISRSRLPDFKKPEKDEKRNQVSLQELLDVSMEILQDK